MPCWAARAWFPVRHPREALCDAGVWKCDTHPRMLWLASERRWAIRHRLRARRVARWSGWTRAELDAMLAPQRDERAVLLARLATAMDAVVRRHAVTTETRSMTYAGVLHTHDPDSPCGGSGTGCLTFPSVEQVTTMFPPWMERLVALTVAARMRGDDVAVVPW